MSAAELRDKSVEELKKELLEALREQFNLRVQQGAGQAVKPHLIKEVRKRIARVKTVLQEKAKGEKA